MTRSPEGDVPGATYGGRREPRYNKIPDSDTFEANREDGGSGDDVGAVRAAGGLAGGAAGTAAGGLAGGVLGAVTGGALGGAADDEDRRDGSSAEHGDGRRAV